MYTFTWPSPAIGGKLGACHIIELPFVFGTLDLPKVDIFFGKGEDANIISQKMMKYWTNFAQLGNPNAKDIPNWSIYDVKERATMFIGKEFKLANNSFENEISAWQELI
jgi:para-nitrobenzyl esterase